MRRRGRDQTLTRNLSTAKLDDLRHLEAVPGITTVGGNKAHGNGNPLQCLNVACR